MKKQETSVKNRWTEGKKLDEKFFLKKSSLMDQQVSG